MGKKRCYTDEQLIEVLKESISINAMLPKLGLKQFPGNWSTVKKSIIKLGLDTSHLKGQGHSKGVPNKFVSKIPLNKILIKNSEYTSSHHLKNRLIKEEILQNKCNTCGIDKWFNQKLSLHLDHINGIHTDNTLENLQLLCPNCHSLTETYSGKNIKRKYPVDRGTLS